MCVSGSDQNRRILLIDDNRATHHEVRSVLEANRAVRVGLDGDQAAPSGSTRDETISDGFEVDSAYQVREGLHMAREALRARRPYAVAFLDVHMPPGWDGLESLAHMWEEDPRIQVVLCTLHSDYTWREIAQTLGETDRLLILKKPFDSVEIRRLACVLSTKWNLARRLEDMTASLNQAAEERTGQPNEQVQPRENTHGQALHARKLECLGWLAAGISHEIKQPLSAITNYVEACKLAAQSAGGAGDRIVADLDNIAAQAARAVHIVTGMSTFLRTRRLNRAKVDMKKLFSDVEHLLECEIRSREVRLQLDCPAVPPVSADPVLVEQVILNLARNAVEAMSEDETSQRRLTLRTRKTNDRFVETVVSDTGPGVPEPLIEKLSEPFYTTKAEGMGIGLTFSRAVIEAHGGRLWPEPNRDRGMTFHFTLPLLGRG